MISVDEIRYNGTRCRLIVGDKVAYKHDVGEESGHERYNCQDIYVKGAMLGIIVVL
jgi:hypothetical protein